MTSPVCTLDLARMRRDRVGKLQAAMADAGIDTLVVCGQNNVSYATGARVPAADHVRAVVVARGRGRRERDDPWPHLYTEFPEGSAVGAARRPHPSRGRGGSRRRRGASSWACSRAVGSRSTTRRSRCGRHSRAARCTMPRSCSARPRSRRRSTSWNAFARRRRSTSARCEPRAPRPGPARWPPICPGHSCARSRSSARRRTRSTRCSR